MTVLFQSGYVAPVADEPLTHARIAHSNNWLSGGTASASSTASGFFANAPLNSLTYEKWKPTSGNATWEYDHGSSAQCDYCVIAAHTLGSSGSTLTVQYWNGILWVNLSPTTAIQSDEPIMAIFEPQVASRWRISVSTGSAPVVGVVKFGRALQMQRALYGGHSPIPFARQTILRSTKSETGEYLGWSKQRTYLQTSYEWQHLTAAWVRSNWPSFQRAVEDGPYFIAWRPATFGDVGFCQTEQVPVPVNMGMRDFMSVTLNVMARGYD
jgi:hypothetical protein